MKLLFPSRFVAGEVQRTPTVGRFWSMEQPDGTFYVGAFLPAGDAAQGYRVLGYASTDPSTGSPETTSHDYSGTLDSLAELIPCGGTCIGGSPVVD